MGTVFRKTVIRPLPRGAEIVTKDGKRVARWKDRRGKSRSAPISLSGIGAVRISTRAATYTAKYRDGSGVVREVATGCRDEDAARSVLAKLERRAELVKSEVLSAAEAATADHQSAAIASHFKVYFDYLRTRNASPVRIANMQSQFDRVARDCGFTRLCELDDEKLTKWLLEREADGMSAATRNGYRETLVMFANWCCRGTKPRLLGNPFVEVPKAKVQTDRRRQRRAMTEAELLKLLAVARWRPLAEFGRESIPAPENPTAGHRRKRSNWIKAELTFDELPAAVERGRIRLEKNPDLIRELDRRGRERALIYKTLVLTGLRKSELASLEVRQLHLTGSMPVIVLDAADEKNRQGSTIPLRADLAADLKEWLAVGLSSPSRDTQGYGRSPGGQTLLFNVPTGLVRILNRDLRAAGIDKADERGRTVDVHALRHSFGTLLSQGGVAPRTAQAAMRHSSIDLTMNTYTDPKLLDIQGALERLPPLDVALFHETDDPSALAARIEDIPSTTVAPMVAPTPGQTGPSESPAVITSEEGDKLKTGLTRRGNRKKPSEKALPAAVASKASDVGATRHR